LFAYNLGLVGFQVLFLVSLLPGGIFVLTSTPVLAGTSIGLRFETGVFEMKENLFEETYSCTKDS
jgi:hypothetical protein